MKHLSIALCVATLACSSLSFANPVTLESKAQPKSATLFDIIDNELVSSTRVEDSVFLYESKDINCDENADEETPCLAIEDKWTSVCFEGPGENVCAQMESLFKSSDEQLMNDGAEEAVELTSCSYETGIPVISYNLISGHGGPNVRVQGKMIPMCPLWF